MPSATSGNRNPRVKPRSSQSDPLDIAPRLYKQLDRLLDDMEAADSDERMTMPQRITGMIALGRIMKMMQEIKKGELNAGAGSAVNKYAAAFQTPYATGGRSEHAGPPNIVEFDRAEPGDPDYTGDDS